MPDVVSVVACGPSALECGAERAPGFVIAVNDAFKHVRHDAVLSMDGRWALHRFPDFGGREGVPLYIRRRALNKLGGFNEVLWPRVRVYDCDHHTEEFADATNGAHPWAQLNGPNSGYVALNLAYSMRPKRVWLFGFDHRGEHFFPEYEWRERGEGSVNTRLKFARWSAGCSVARHYFDNIGCRVFNTNRKSCVVSFEFKAWI